MNQNDREARRRRERMNSLKLRHPETSEMLTLNRDGRSDPFCDHMMRCLNDSAAVFLHRSRTPRRKCTMRAQAWRRPKPRGS